MEENKFGENLLLRVSSSTMNKIKELTEKHPERFSNKSHFVRVAVLRLIRECEQHGE